MNLFRLGNLNYFLEQRERVQRWKYRCDSSPNKLDFYDAFFINSYHLKDWMLQWLTENNRIDLLQKIQTDFKKEIFLKVLKDICNGTKHFTLNQHAELGKQYAIVNEYNLGTIRQVILIGGIKYPINDLLNDVFKYWDEFMRKNGLDKLNHDVRGPLIPFD